MHTSDLHLEEFHSTPETQTDESYNHPEDLEHFAHHEAIEREEAEKEAEYQGISVEEALAQHDLPEDLPVEDEAQQPLTATDPEEPAAEESPVQATKPKIQRVTPPEKQDPRERFRSASEQMGNKAEWGAGDDGYKSPKSPVDKMRCVLIITFRYPQPCLTEVVGHF